MDTKEILKRLGVILLLTGAASATLTSDLNDSMATILALVDWIAPIATRLIPAVIAFGILAIVSAFVGMMVTIFYILPKVFKINIMGHHKKGD